MEQNLAGQVAIVSGGSRGIGRAVVEELSGRGAAVHFTFVKGEDAARAVEATCAERPGSASGHRCDSRDGAAVEALVDEVVAATDRLDAVVLNAGITRDRYLMLMSEEEFTAVVDTNLTGAFRFAKAACRPMMARRTGCIVTVSSIAAVFGVAGQANYCASKGGIAAMTRALAAELAPKNVRVNGVLPGFVETEMTAKMPRGVKRQSLERVLVKRFGEPEEIAAVVAFLASDAASYIHGQLIAVDGGLTSTVG